MSGNRISTRVDNKFTRWDDMIHDPQDRCDAVTRAGPCPYLVVEGARTCPMHGGTVTAAKNEREQVRNFQIQRWQARINDFADNDQVKSLREEIGIMRLMLEETLNQCTDHQQLLMFSHRISDMVMKIEKLVVSADKLENRMGLLLSKSAVIQLASTYVNIITAHVDDIDIVEAIGTEIMEATKAIEDPKLMGQQEQLR